MLAPWQNDTPPTPPLTKGGRTTTQGRSCVFPPFVKGG
jgi:hypothetical protein